MFCGGLIGGVDLLGIMSAECHPAQVIIGEVLDQFQEARITTEQMFPDIGTAFDGKVLIFAVYNFSECPDQNPFRVTGQQGVHV